MLGLMQDWPLLIHKIIDFAAIQHGNQEVVSRLVEGPIHRESFRELHGRSLKVAQRLAAQGVKLGDRVATLAWNTHRHLETWYGITGVGAIYHTVNPRLFPEQIVWIMNHAEDKVVFVDLTFAPLLDAIADKCGHHRRTPFVHGVRRRDTESAREQAIGCGRCAAALGVTEDRDACLVTGAGL